MKERYIQKECKHHGKCKFILENRGAYRCTKCRSERVSKCRRKRKAVLVEYKGGKCELCGYNKCIAALEFHHKDHTKKEFGLAKSGITRSLEATKKEVDKCMLVCSNCHKEIHSEEGYLHNAPA